MSYMKKAPVSDRGLTSRDPFNSTDYLMSQNDDPWLA